MEFCSQCGIPLPNEQTICSVCIGDEGFGDDLYYEQWLEEQERKAYERRMEEEYYEELAEHEKRIGGEDFGEFNF